MARCTYCELPATTTDPFSGSPCCRVDFELLAGGLDEQPFASYVERAAERMTLLEQRAWRQMVSDRFGGARENTPREDA